MSNIIIAAIIGVLIGFVMGVIIGVVVMALAAAAGRSEAINAAKCETIERVKEKVYPWVNNETDKPCIACARNLVNDLEKLKEGSK